VSVAIIHYNEIDPTLAKKSACRSCWSNFLVTIQYVISELSKKKEAFQIGIFTVFLVVMIITMLKGVIDAMPVLFLQIAETQNGSLDFRMTPVNADFKLNLGTQNYYAVDPFDAANLNINSARPKAKTVIKDKVQRL
jgi:hypothetical protein